MTGEGSVERDLRKRLLGKIVGQPSSERNYLTISGRRKG